MKEVVQGWNGGGNKKSEGNGSVKMLGVIKVKQANLNR